MTNQTINLSIRPFAEGMTEYNNGRRQPKCRRVYYYSTYVHTYLPIYLTLGSAVIRTSYRKPNLIRRWDRKKGGQESPPKLHGFAK